MRSRTDATAPRSARRTRLVVAGAALIGLAITVAYLPALRGVFIFDDDLLLTSNPLISDPGGLYRIWFTADAVDYWPISNTSLWLEWRLWGPNATGYHLTNLLLHVGNALLVWAVLARLTLPGAFLAALLFAVHPVNVESVAWIAQRKSVMAQLFALLSILCFLRAQARPIEPGDRPTFGDTWYWLSLAAFVLAMLSKASAAPVPLILLAIVWWSRRVDWRAVVRLAPFVLVDVVLIGVNIVFARHSSGPDVRHASMLERLLGAATALWFYLWKALLPLDLAFVYPQWHIEPTRWVWWLPLLAAVATTAILWWFRRTWSRPFVFAWLCFVIALAPVLGFIDAGFMRYSPVADHYQYSALISVVAVVAAGWAFWRRSSRGAARSASHAVAAIAVGVLVLLTWQQSRLYASPLELYTETLTKNPDSWMLHTNLATVFMQSGRPADAIAHYERSLQLNPASPETHLNLATLLDREGRHEQATAHYEEALRLAPQLPEVHNNLGTALADSGRTAEAIAHYRAALQFKPDYPEVHNNLANALMQEGNLDEAIAHYHEALRSKPDYAEAHNNLGLALTRLHRYDEASASLRAALQLNPDFPEARYNLGVALAQQGAPAEARREFEYALRLRPDYAEAHNDLGVVLVQTGQLDEAIPHFERALRLQPTLADAHENLQVALAMKTPAAQAPATPAIDR